MKPTISIDVDARNPGQVFACMGLFELACCLAGRRQQALAWFEDTAVTHTQFHISAFREPGVSVTLDDVVIALRNCEVEEMEFNDKEGPVRLGVPFDLVIDWRDAYPRNGTVKTWAGQQRMGSIVENLIEHLPRAPDRALLSVPATTSGSVTFFNAAQSMGSLDVGFSHDKLKLYHLSVFPTCELLCLIGLLRACPHETGRYSRRYAVWSAPLPLNAASLAVSTTVPMGGTAVLGFDMFKRTPDGKYKSFASATPVIH